MPTTEHQGYGIEWQLRPERAAGTLVLPYHVDVREQDGTQVFSLDVRIDQKLLALREHQVVTSEGWQALVDDLVLPWARGLIDLGRFAARGTHEESRGTDWNPLFGERSVTEDALRDEVLAALHRAYRRGRARRVLCHIDPAAVAVVLGVRVDRVREILGDLELAGYVEEEGAHFGSDVVDGACVLTRAGYAELQRRRPAAPANPPAVASAPTASATAMPADASTPAPEIGQGAAAKADKPVGAFISYSWDSEEHKAWVLELATRLRRDGIDVTLDRWHLAPGDPLPEFMERGVRENDSVLIVCTPPYKVRSDQRRGGAGYEGTIMTAEVLLKANHRKFIPLWRSGRWEEAAPSWLAGNYRLDFRSDPYGEQQYQELLDTLLGRRPTAPPLGPTPPPRDGETAPSRSGTDPAGPPPSASTTPALAARPLVALDHAATNTNEETFTPEYRIRHIAGEAVPLIRWRFRGPRFSQMEWRTLNYAHLSRVRLTERFDLRGDPQPDELVGEDEMGIEIEFDYRGQRCRELHRWPLNRQEFRHKATWTPGRELDVLYLDEPVRAPAVDERLEIRFEARRPYVEVRTQQTPNGQVEFARLARIGVFNRTTKIIRDVSASLICLARFDERTGQEIEDTVPGYLQWEGYATDVRAVDVPPESEQLANVVVRRTTTDRTIEMQIQYASRKTPDVPAVRHTFTIRVTGEDLALPPRRFVVDVDEAGVLLFTRDDARA